MTLKDVERLRRSVDRNLQSVTGWVESAQDRNTLWTIRRLLNETVNEIDCLRQEIMIDIREGRYP